MKVFIAFLICIVTVFGKEEEISDHAKKINEMLKGASQACVKEMKLDPSFINDNGYANHPNLDVEACLKACVDKKMGVLNEDGTYSLERILSYAGTPEMKRRMENVYFKKIKECTSLVGGEACKMAACAHGMPRSAYMKTNDDSYD